MDGHVNLRESSADILYTDYFNKYKVIKKKGWHWKTVYACFCTDVIHEEYMNIIRKAKEYGEVIAGVFCDSEMIRYNRFPTVSIEERIRGKYPRSVSRSCEK